MNKAHNQIRDLEVSLKNLGRADLFTQLSAESPAFGPRLVCELMAKDEDMLVAALRREEDPSSLSRFWLRLLVEISDDQLMELQPQFAARLRLVTGTPALDRVFSTKISAEINSSKWRSTLAEELGSRMIRVHDTLTLLQATEDADCTLILAPIRRRAAISIQAVARSYVQTQLCMRCHNAATQTEKNTLMPPLSEASPAGLNEFKQNDMYTTDMAPIQALHDGLKAVSLSAQYIGVSNDTVGINTYTEMLRAQVGWVIWRMRTPAFGAIDTFLKTQATCVNWDVLRYLAKCAGYVDVKRYLKDQNILVSWDKLQSVGTTASVGQDALRFPDQSTSMERDKPIAYTYISTYHDHLDCCIVDHPTEHLISMGDFAAIPESFAVHHTPDLDLSDNRDSDEIKPMLAIHIEETTLEHVKLRENNLNAMESKVMETVVMENQGTPGSLANKKCRFQQFTDSKNAFDAASTLSTSRISDQTEISSRLAEGVQEKSQIQDEHVSSNGVNLSFYPPLLEAEIRLPTDVTLLTTTHTPHANALPRDSSLSNTTVARASFSCPRCAWSEHGNKAFTGDLGHPKEQESSTVGQGVVMEIESSVVLVQGSGDNVASDVAEPRVIHEEPAEKFNSHKLPMVSVYSQAMVSATVGFSPLLKVLVGKRAGMALKNVVPLSLETSLLRVNQILADKAVTDATMEKNGHPAQSLPSYVSSWHLMRFGLHATARRHEMRLHARLFLFLKAYRGMATTNVSSKTNSASEALNSIARRRLRQFSDLLGISASRASLYSPLVQNQFMLLLSRLFPGDSYVSANALLPVTIKVASQRQTNSDFQHTMDQRIHRKQTDVVSLSRVVCAFVGSGLNVDVDEPATWDAPYLLQVASKKQLKQLLKKARALPQISRRAASGIVIDRGIAVDDVLDLALSFVFDRAKEIQGRLRANFDAFDTERLSWCEFSNLIKSLDEHTLVSSEQAVDLFKEVQIGEPRVDASECDPDRNEGRYLLIDPARFARGAWKAGVFQRVTTPVPESRDPIRTPKTLQGLVGCKILPSDADAEDWQQRAQTGNNRNGELNFAEAGFSKRTTISLNVRHNTTNNKSMKLRKEQQVRNIEALHTAFADASRHRGTPHSFPHGRGFPLNKLITRTNIWRIARHTFHKRDIQASETCVFSCSPSRSAVFGRLKNKQPAFSKPESESPKQHERLNQSQTVRKAY